MQPLIGAFQRPCSPTLAPLTAVETTRPRLAAAALTQGSVFRAPTKKSARDLQNVIPRSAQPTHSKSINDNARRTHFSLATRGMGRLERTCRLAAAQQLLAHCNDDFPAKMQR